MPRIKESMLNCTVTLNPKQAIALRELGIKLDYRCPNPECDAPVIVVSKGKDNRGVEYKAHFEHKKRNRKCPYGKGVKTVTPQVPAEVA
jgi:hypothetical protein